MTISEFIDHLLRESPVVDGGLRLPTERALSASTGLSRASVREYLSALQVLGLVRKVQGSGNMLQLPAPEAAGAVFDLMIRSGQVTTTNVSQAREMYEIGMVPFVLARVTAADIAKLDRHVADMIEASGREDFERALEADYAFHRTLFNILDNPITDYTLDGLQLALRDLVAERRRCSLAAEIRGNGGTAPAVFETDHVHALITDGIRRQDRAATAQAMTEHYALWRRLNPGVEPPTHDS